MGPGESRAPEPLDPALVRERVASASRLREALFGPFGGEAVTDVYRLIHGAGDGLEGFLVDAYAGYIVLQVERPGLLGSAPLLEEALAALLSPRGIVRKLRYRKEERGRVAGEVIRGEEPPAALQVREEGIPFEVELRGGFHTGFFSDMREERLRLRRLARGRRVLNTFAYTGAFSVAAAAGGAARVTSVDVVAKALERAKRNFRLAGLDPGAHHFARLEVLEYLRLARRRGWLFDAIVLDPPTFASFKSGRWSVKDYPELLRRALAVLAREGLLWAAANTEGLPPGRLEAQIAAALDECGRQARTLAIGGLPPDYPTPADAPEKRYLKVHVLQVL
jgi:23S rRNA (cytosine1962-C5)-methyltransferase